MNEGLKALKKSHPDVAAKIMGMSTEELKKAAAKGMKILKQYGFGGKMYSDGGVAKGEHSRSMLKPLENRSGVLFGEKKEFYDDEGNLVAKEKQTSKLGQLLGRPETKIKIYEEGGKETGDEKKDKKELTTDESALLDVLRRAMATPGVEVTGSSASPALRQGLGYTSAVDATAAPIKGFIAPGGEERPAEPVVTVAPGRISPIAPRQPGPMPIKIERGIVPPGMQVREVMPDQYAPGMVFDPKMRGQQRPRAMYQYDYDAGSYKERPIEIEELAHYLYSQQIPGAEGMKMRDGKYVKVDAYPTIEDAARVAQRLLSGDPSLGRGRANMPPGYGYGGKMMK